jgi:hypothetical protein
VLYYLMSTTDAMLVFMIDVYFAVHFMLLVVATTLKLMLCTFDRLSSIYCSG